MFEEGLNLLPCPHCGKPATLWAVDMSEGVYVFCDNCGMRGPLTEEMTESAAISAWNALPRRLRWTNEKPTEPDFYWNRDGRLLRIGEILEISGALFCHFAGESEPQLLELVGGEWARIPEPEESHDAAE